MEHVLRPSAMRHTGLTYGDRMYAHSYSLLSSRTRTLHDHRYHPRAWGHPCVCKGLSGALVVCGIVHIFDGDGVSLLVGLRGVGRWPNLTRAQCAPSALYSERVGPIRVSVANSFLDWC